MQKVSEYRLNAEDCRVLARKTSDASDRQTLLRMADAWEALANDRIAALPTLKPFSEPRTRS